MNRFVKLAARALTAVVVAGALLITAAPAHAARVNYIRAVHSGKCVTVHGWSTANGAIIDQWTCVGQANQRWNLIINGLGRYWVKSESSNKCLDGGNMTKGTKVTQWTCTSNKPGQAWAVVNVAHGLRFHVGTKCLDVDGGSTANGARLILWTCNDQPNQAFDLI